MALRGIDFISATAFLAEIGDLSRFRTPRELMAYLGLVPSEASTGDTVKRGPILDARLEPGRPAMPTLRPKLRNIARG
jgi:transposase